MQHQEQLQNQTMMEQQFQDHKKQALLALQQASQTVQQNVTSANLQSLQQAQQQLGQAVQQLNQMQGLAATQSATTEKQQLEQVTQQIEQASQTLSLIQSLNIESNSFKKG